MPHAVLHVRLEDQKGTRPRASASNASSLTAGKPEAAGLSRTMLTSSRTMPTTEGSATGAGVAGGAAQKLLDASDATTRLVFERALAAPIRGPVVGGGDAAEATSPKSTASLGSSQWRGLAAGSVSDGSEYAENAVPARDVEVTVIGAKNLPKMDRSLSLSLSYTLTHTRTHTHTRNIPERERETGGGREGVEGTSLALSCACAVEWRGVCLTTLLLC